MDEGACPSPIHQRRQGGVEFRAYLESQFTTGMTWENKGTWHIDHRRPCASFDFTDPEQDGALLAYIDDTHAPVSDTVVPFITEKKKS